jgi:putative copper export protein
MFWLGGMFFLAIVGAPILRRIEPPALRAQLFGALGRAFRTASWVAITVLIATGVVNLHFRGLLSAAFWHSTPLLVKLAAVIVMVALSAIHDFWLGPAASRAPAGSREAIALRRWSAIIARLNALAAPALVAAAVRLTRG